MNAPQREEEVARRASEAIELIYMDKLFVVEAVKRVTGNRKDLRLDVLKSVHAALSVMKLQGR